MDSNGNVINLNLKTKNKLGTVKIPSQIDGKNVISLKGASLFEKDGAFTNCAGLTGITIPNTITTIGDSAFSNCTGLKSITLPDSVTTIESNAFSGCTGLKSITLSNNLSSIYNYTFSRCSGLKSLTIPNSVTTIEKSAFSNCSGLTQLTLSKNLSKIAEGTFNGCSGLTSVILPDSVTTIDGSAFESCKNLEKILIPDSVASIGKYVFYSCDKLTIYGNDGMTSKEYAEANKIKFDYIANWDKKDSGTDITPPTVKSIAVTYASVMNYNKDANKNMYMVPAGAKLVINVNFSEIVKGTTVPTLTIKFGDGKNIKVTEGTIGGSTITYIYTVQNSDKGVMTTVDLSGGSIKDSSGNIAKLSCPSLSIQYSSGFVYANGSATNPDNGTDKPNNGNTNKPDNGSSNTSGTNNNGSTNNSETDGKQDNTIATGKLPHAGLGIGLISTIILLISGSIFVYIKYRNLRDI